MRLIILVGIKNCGTDVRARAPSIKQCLFNILSDFCITRCTLDKKASRRLIHRASGRIRESESERSLDFGFPFFFSKGKRSKRSGLLGSRSSCWHRRCEGVTFTGAGKKRSIKKKTWMNINGESGRSSSTGHVCTLRVDLATSAHNKVPESARLRF